MGHLRTLNEARRALIGRKVGKRRYSILWSLLLWILWNEHIEKYMWKDVGGMKLLLICERRIQNEAQRALIGAERSKKR